MDPQGWSSVSNVLTFASNPQLQDLGKAIVVVAGWVQLKGDSPLFGEDREGCQYRVPLQQMFSWKGEGSLPVKFAIAISILKGTK